MAGLCPMLPCSPAGLAFGSGLILAGAKPSFGITELVGRLL